MLFATTALAARIEGADCGLLTEAVEAIARERPEADVFIRGIAGGIATFSGQDSPLNKVAGLGFADPVDEAELQEIERLYAERGTPVQVELSCLADSSVGALLTRRGYSLVGFENVLGRLLPPDGPPSVDPPGVEVEVTQDFETWLDIAVTGFQHPDREGVPSHEVFPRDVLERVLGDLAGAEGFLRYLARRNGEPAGAASARFADGVAQLAGATTLPEHRRRGVQTALLGRRLADATAAGCDVATVTTQPGSKSQENVQRRGFDLLYTRAVLVLEP